MRVVPDAGLLVRMYGVAWRGAAAAERGPLAQYTIDAWNPSYCKVAEFYGLYQPESAASRVAYVSIANPSDKAQKPSVYAATFQELSPAHGRQQWFLTGLVTHSSGILTKRQGWDDLMVPVQEAPPAAAEKKS